MVARRKDVSSGKRAEAFEETIFPFYPSIRALQECTKRVGAPVIFWIAAPGTMRNIIIYWH